MKILKIFIPLSFLMCVFFVFALVGCGGKAATPATSVNPATQSPTSTAPPPPPPAPAPAPPPPPPGNPPSNATVIPQIEDKSNWQWCTATTSAGNDCASGLGTATSSKTDDQTSPSRDGSSAKFDIGGDTPYSNALWWRTLSPNSDATHFVYDLWFYVDHPEFAQALEFDVDQSFGGTRWVFGTECAYLGSGKWDVWDGGAHHWVPTSAPCPQVSAATWHHLIWQFERVKGQTHFISVTLDDKTMNVDMYQDAQSNFDGDGVDVAFQMDGDSKQNPFIVWLDQVTLTEW